MTALASPGPRVTTTAPGAPVRSALVAAMIVAAVSPRVSTKRSPAASAAPTTSRLGPPPGTPNISRVPAWTSAAAIASAAAGAVLAFNEAPLLSVILWCPWYVVKAYAHSFGTCAPRVTIRPRALPSMITKGFRVCTDSQVFMIMKNLLARAAK